MNSDSLKIIIDSLISLNNDSIHISNDTLFVSIQNGVDYTPYIISGFMVILTIMSLYFNVKYTNQSIKHNNNSLKIMENHNKLIVKPLLRIHSDFRLEGEQISLSLKNNGVGPAIIKSSSQKWQGKDFFNSDYELNISTITCMHEYFKTEDISIRFLTKGLVIKEGEEVPIFSVKINEYLRNNYHLIYDNWAKNLEIEIKSESLYNEESVINTNT